MTSASTVLHDEVSPDESGEDEGAEAATDGEDGEDREKSLDDIIDAYAE